MRRLLAFALVALAVVLQVSFLPALRPFGVVPNLTLVIVVLVAVSVPTSQVLIAAAAAGLVLDLAGGANFGLWTGVLILAALVIGLLHRSGIELGRVIVAVVLVTAGTLVLAAVIWLGIASQTGRWPGGRLAGQLGIELVLNLSLVMMLRPGLQRLLADTGPVVGE